MNILVFQTNENQPHSFPVFSRFCIAIGCIEVFYFNTGADSVTFTVHENTGVISTNALLDRESQHIYSFTITTTDSGGRISLATVNVTVSDVNDNSPVCGEAVYAASVAESAAVATSVISVSCPDLDISSSGEVR